MPKPELAPELCDGCGKCVAACHGEGIIQLEGKVKIMGAGNCDFCGVCEAVCSRGAIKCLYSIIRQI